MNFSASENDIRAALNAARARNKSAFVIISEVTGIPEKRLREIAEGRGKTPDTFERMTIRSQM